jgi:hypothetical protein
MPPHASSSLFAPHRWLARDGLWDRAAISLSGLCLIHCVLTLVLVALLSSVGGVLLDPVIHEVGTGLAIGLGVFALGKGVLDHGYIMPAAIGGMGLGMMIGALQLPHGGEEALYTVVGVGILALGHDLNYRATH